MVPALFTYRNEQVHEWKSDAKPGSKQLVARRLQLLQKWLGVDAAESTITVDWNSFFPASGAFVGPDGYVIRATDETPARFLRQEGLDAVLDLPTFSSLNPHTVVLIDWASQSIPAAEIVELWDEWESQKKILTSGPVLVPFSAWKEWTFPYYVVFRGEFRGEPLRTVSARILGGNDKDRSLLARAHALKTATDSSPTPSRTIDPSVVTEPLPMIPFTLASLSDSSFTWPIGVEGIEVKRVSQRNSSQSQEPDSVYLDLEEDEFALT